MLRTYKCEHCGYEKTYLGVTDHYNTCNNYPLPCLIGCGVTIMRKDTAAHQNECPHVEINCPKGCGVIIMRKDVTAHQNECPHDFLQCEAVVISRERRRSHECIALGPLEISEDHVRNFIPYCCLSHYRLLYIYA